MYEMLTWGSAIKEVLLSTFGIFLYLSVGFAVCYIASELIYKFRKYMTFIWNKRRS